MSTAAHPPAEVEEIEGPPPASRVLEITAAVIGIAFSTIYLVLGTQIALRRAAAPGQMDARFWPLVLGTLGVAVGVALLVIALTRPPPDRDDIERQQPGGVLRVAVTFGITLAYVAVWSISAIVLFGYQFEVFPIATAIYMFVLLWLYGLRKWIALIVYPVGVTAFIYILFGLLLRIPL